MNRKQLAALWIGIAVAVAMLLVPPNRYGREGDLIGYRFIADRRGDMVDTPRLFLGLAVVGLVTAGLVATLAGKRR